MNITILLAVYNNLKLTKEFYRLTRNLYPSVPFVISSGGSNDGTEEWLESLVDPNLKYFHTPNRISFSDTYNNGMMLVKTEKFVLVHNDMIIGESFLENLDELITEDTILSYTTIEPPIFAGHRRPGKVIIDMGSGFDDFDFENFNRYVELNKNNKTLYDGAVFFMSGYKKSFDDIGGFDGDTFYPCFCEDDDFLIRAKLKGYKLKTTECAITYHFVSQTSRFSEEFMNERHKFEFNSNRNFVRKWGIPIHSFNEINYQSIEDFNYKKFSMGLIMTTIDFNLLTNLEPFFDKILCDSSIGQIYINNQQETTVFDLESKFQSIDDCNVIITISQQLKNDDFETLMKLRFVLPQYEKGNYKVGNLLIDIRAFD